MGICCFKSTPASTYNSYLNVANISLLKEQWSPLKLFKLKKIFQNNCYAHQRTKESCLNQATFIKLLLEFDESKFNNYTDANKKRLFDLFDRENTGYLSWHNFFIGLTICEFASDQILAVVLFAIFDTNLKRQLNMEQLLDLLNKNSMYLKEEEDEEDVLDGETIAASLLDSRTSIGIDQWIQKSQNYIDYFQFRKLFNIFEEEQMERDMAMNFNQINNLYNMDKGRYVGYVLNYKWFQSWKTYIYKEFNIQVNGFSENLTYIRTTKTLKTMKTKKTIRSMKSVKSLKSSKSFNSGKSNKKTIKYPMLKEIINIFKNLENSHIKQYNLIYSNIGDKPFQINNNLLEGQFSELLMPELVENINYVLVSEEVWRRLKLIYGAYPQFRRTGEQAIQIYPKLFKIFTKIHNGKIDYEEEKVCEFSKFMQMDHLISKALQLTIEDLQNYVVFCKSCSNYKWEELTDLTLMASEVSSQQMVFMAIVEVNEADEFREINCKIASNIKELHIGDQFMYCLPLQKTAIKAVFMGKDKYKIIIHFRGLSYIYDICIDRDQFYLRSKLDRRGMDTTRHKVCLEELELIGLPNSKGLSFINSLLLSLFNNTGFTSQLQKFYCEKPTTLLQYLALILHMLSNSSHANTIIISDMIRYFFTKFTDFEFTMGEMFVEQFMTVLHRCFQQQKLMINPIEQYLIQSQKLTSCNLCHKNSSERIQAFTLTLSIPEEQIKYYEIIYVPFAYSLKSVEIKRYGFSLPKASTMDDYKEMFQKVADLKETPYVLAEIQGNNIIKNYLNARGDATLEDLLLRQDDHIYAYQLCFRIDNFINDHYCNDSVIKLRNLKVGQLIDFEKEGGSKRKSTNHHQIKQGADQIEKSDEKTMTFGKIVSIQTESYTHKLLLKVEHRENRGDIICSTINPENNNIAIFPTRSYLFADHYHIRVLQRFFNEVSNQMQMLTIPFIVLITSWMRMKELELFIYQQVRMLIHDDYKFSITQQSDLEEGVFRIKKSEKIKKFKQYLYGSNLPYEIKFTDLNGRCAVCCKIQKSKPREDEEQFTCCGCNLDPQLPIFWQIRPYQSRVCVDWRLPEACVKPCISDHNSFAVARSARKNCVLQLEDCINYKLTHGESDECSCSFFESKKIDYVERILNNPQRVIITFDRIIEEDQNYKHISRKYIHFEVEQMKLNGSLYQLVAATSIEGSQMDARYLTYIRNKNHWLEYNGQKVRIVKKGWVQKICALTLHYRKICILFDQKNHNWK